MNTTPIPNILLDRYLSRLKDTELRVVLIVLRSTAGWAMPDGSRKKRDWISHSQFKTRCGRSGGAVSKAIDALVRQGFIEASTRSGRFLTTPRSRKSEVGKVHYALGPLLLDGSKNPTPQSEAQIAETTKASTHKRKTYKRISKESGFACSLGSNSSGWENAAYILDRHQKGGE